MAPVQHVGCHNSTDKDVNSSNPVTPFNDSGNIHTERFSSIQSWLDSLGLTAYLDQFHDRGYISMKDLDMISLQDLVEMKIGEGHRNILWKSLVDYRIKQETTNNLSQSQGQYSQASNASDVSGRSTQRRITVTRYRYTHKIDYCSNEEVDE